MQVCDLGDLDCICEAFVATISTDEFCTKSFDVETAFIFLSFFLYNFHQIIQMLFWSHSGSSNEGSQDLILAGECLNQSLVARSSNHNYM